MHTSVPHPKTNWSDHASQSWTCDHDCFYQYTNSDLFLPEVIVTLRRLEKVAWRWRWEVEVGVA